MIDKEYKSIVSKVRKLVAYWFPILGLDRWQRITIDYKDESGPDEGSVCARTWVQWEYKMGTINFYIREMLEMSDMTLEYTVLHEFCHLLVNPMHVKKSKQEEFVVTSLAQGYLNAHHNRTKAKRKVGK